MGSFRVQGLGFWVLVVDDIATQYVGAPKSDPNLGITQFLKGKASMGSGLFGTPLIRVLVNRTLEETLQ